VLPDSRSEDDPVEPAERVGQRRRLAGDAEGEQVERLVRCRRGASD
jgi:hypothetical protein